MAFKKKFLMCNICCLFEGKLIAQDKKVLEVGDVLAGAGGLRTI